MNKNKKTKKKRNYKKIFIIIFSVICILCITGFAVYKKVLEPVIDQKLDVVIAKLDNVSNNEQTQREIDNVVKSMIDDGVISESSIPQYMKMMEENEEEWNEQKILEQIEQVTENDGATDKGNKTEQTSKSNATDESKSSSVDSVTNSEKTDTASKQSENKDSSKITTSAKNQEKNKNSTSKQNLTADQKSNTGDKGEQNSSSKSQGNNTTTQKKSSASSSTSSSGDLRTRMKEAMTASEFAFATSMYGKIDLGYAQSLYATDKAAAKEYIYSRVSAAEISQALEIYAKYAYLVG